MILCLQINLLKNEAAFYPVINLLIAEITKLPLLYIKLTHIYKTKLHRTVYACFLLAIQANSRFFFYKQGLMQSNA